MIISGSDDFKKIPINTAGLKPDKGEYPKGYLAESTEDFMKRVYGEEALYTEDDYTEVDFGDSSDGCKQCQHTEAQRQEAIRKAYKEYYDSYNPFGTIGSEVAREKKLKKALEEIDELYGHSKNKPKKSSQKELDTSDINPLGTAPLYYKKT